MQNALLHAGLLKMQLQLSPDDEARLIDYLHLLQKWNKAYNLTAITDFDKMISYHLLDSLSIAPYIMGEKIVDVGSGAGLPGIPLAVYFPQKQFTLIDSIGKKTRFMTQAVRELGLSNVEVVQTRAEEYQTPHCFDTMIARAVASVDELIRISKHLLAENGKLLMMKSDAFSSEISSVHQIVALSVPGVDSPRFLIVV